MARHAPHFGLKLILNLIEGGNLFNQGRKCFSVFVRGSNIKEYQFVGTFLHIALCQFHRIACISDINKIDSLYRPSITNIKAGNDSFF